MAGKLPVSALADHQAAPDAAMIAAAAARLAPVVRRTPLLSSPFLDEIAGRRVLVKAECLQHTGSFKLRGGFAAVSALSGAARARGVLAWSSGNHAQGVALAARMHGVRAMIVMPRDAPQTKIDATRALGADLVLHDRATEPREEIGATLIERHGLTLIRPFDDPQVIAGQASTGLELADQAAAEGVAKADVLIPCGGGGLTAGVALAMAETAPGLRARPVEPEGFDDTARSLAAGHRLSNDARMGLCDAIVTPTPGALTFPVLQRLCGPGLVVPDRDALRAMAAAFERLKLVLEPGGAVALAAALFQPNVLQGDAVIVIASGGNVDRALFADALTRKD